MGPSSLDQGSNLASSLRVSSFSHWTARKSRCMCFSILEAAATWGKLFHGGQQKDKEAKPKHTSTFQDSEEMRPEKSLLIHCQPWDAQVAKGKDMWTGNQTPPRKVRARRNR